MAEKASGRCLISSERSKTFRKTGIAWDLDEHTQGISAAGFAFQDPVGLTYAISVPVPSHRFSAQKERLAEQLAEARTAVLKLV